MPCCVLQTSRLPSSLSQEIAKYQWSLTTSPSTLLLQSALLWKGLCTILLCSALSYALLCPVRSCQVPQQLYQTSACLLLLYTTLYLVRFMHHSYCSTLLCSLFVLQSTVQPKETASSTLLYSALLCSTLPCYHCFTTADRTHYNDIQHFIIDMLLRYSYYIQEYVIA